MKRAWRNILLFNIHAYMIPVHELSPLPVTPFQTAARDMLYEIYY